MDTRAAWLMLVLVTLWLVLADVSNLAQLIFSRLLEPFRTIDSLHINLHHSGAGHGPVIVKPTKPGSLGAFSRESRASAPVAVQAPQALRLPQAVWGQGRPGFTAEK